MPSRVDRINARRIGLVLITLGPLLLFSRMLLSGQVLYWGTPMLQFVPWHRFAIEALRQGNFPLWNPLLGTGAPLLANLQSALLYPPNLLLLIVGPEQGHGFLVVLHLIFAGVGMALLARKLGMGAFAQVIAGVSFSLSGYMVARSWFISINHTAAWLPWLILSAEVLLEGLAERRSMKRSLPALLALALTLAMQWLAGHAQTAWYSGLMLAAWMLWRMKGQMNRSAIAWIGTRCLLSGILAFTITASQLLPTLEYLSLSQRVGALDREFALTYSFWPWRFLGLLFPGIFGSPANGDYWGYGNYWEDAIYIGVLPLLLGIGSLWRGLRQRKAEFSFERFLFIICSVTVLLALGKNTPLFPFLFDHIPTFNLFQAPSRWNILLIFSLALLAARGAEHWKTPQGWSLYWTRLFTAGAGIIAIASYLALRWIPDLEPSFVSSFALGGISLTLCGLFTLFFPKDRAVLKVGIIGGFIIADMILAGRGLNPSISPEVFEGNVLGKQGIVGRLYMPADLEQYLKFEQIHRFDTFDPGVDWSSIREIALPNTSMLDGVASLNNFDPLLSDRFVEFTTALEEMEPADRESLLEWMDVAYRIESDPDDPRNVRYEALSPRGRVHLVSESLTAASGKDALELIRLGKIDLDRQVVLEGISTPLSDRGGAGEVLAFAEQGPNALSIRVRMADDGWLVLADAWYPGWEATIDGVPVEVQRANYLFRGLAVPEGLHDIQFQYKPLSFRVGSLLSVLGVLSTIVLGYLCLRKD